MNYSGDLLHSWGGVLPTEISFTTADLTNILLFVSFVLLIGIAAVRFASRTGLPTLLLYLGLGMLLGKEGLGVQMSGANLTQVIGYAALVIILIEGGLTTEWESIKRSVAPAMLLSTLGVVVSVATVAAGCYLWMGTSWNLALLIGAIVSSTDAAAVFSVLRRVPLPSRLTGILEAESGFNDAPVVLLVVALASQSVPGSTSVPWWQIALLAGVELIIGAILGVGLGWLFGRIFMVLAPASSGLFSIAVLASVMFTYAVTNTVHGSGFLATYLSALVIGNMRVPHRQALLGFSTALGWLTQISLFVILGLVVTPSRLHEQIMPALLVGALALFVGRPASIIVSMTPFRVPWRDQVFLSWAGLRGAVPIVLAAVPTGLGMPNTEWIFDLVFLQVLIFTLLQGPTLPWVARLLGLEQREKARDIQVEAMSLDDLDAEVMEVHVHQTSNLAGVAVGELRLVEGAHVTLISRNDQAYVPNEYSVIRPRDNLLIVTTRAARDAVEQRISEVSRSGRLAGWRRASSEN